MSPKSELIRVQIPAEAPLHFFFDTETNLIVPGNLCPQFVCGQWAFDDAEPQVASHIETGFFIAYDKAIRDDNCLVEAWNSPFDHAVVAAAQPDLVQPIFRMLAKGRGRDSMILAKLKSIADGTLQRKPPPKFDLGTHAAKNGLALDKGQDSWRYRYITLWGLKANEYPKEALQYCHEDVTSLRTVSRSLRAEFSSPDEWLQVAAAFALHLAAIWGVRTDGARLRALETRLLAENAECEKVLTDGGFFRDGSVNQTAVRAAVERACDRLGKPVPKTAGTAKSKPKVKIDADTIESVADAEPNLAKLVTHSANIKLLSTYLAPMAGGIDHAMISRPNVLVASGRTSWAGMELDLHNPWVPEADVETVRCGFNLQNPPKLEGIRDCVVPRPGYYWLSVDYDSLEVRAFAQACLWVTGRSSLAQRYRDDPEYDPHSELAAKVVGITYREALERKAKDKTFKSTWRQWAKAGVFGFPGGMSANKFVLYTNGQIEDKKNHITEAFARQIRESWFDMVPEAKPYFDYISWIANSTRELKQFVSGRIRGDVGFCDGANTLFQGLAADGAKRALFAVSMACYAEPQSPLFGSRPVGFVHDEICAEVPIPKAHEAAFETVRLMKREMSEVIVDVRIDASPALSTAWVKKAEAKYEEGRLVPWQ